MIPARVLFARLYCAKISGSTFLRVNAVQLVGKWLTIRTMDVL